jgi:uncharacterized protein with gpF-like domain
MNSLFDTWAKKEGYTPGSNKENKKSDVIDKNNKMLLKSILFTNKRYMKEEIPQNYKYDEDTGEFTEIDIIEIMNKITPFTTNKESLYERLEKDREDHLSKTCTS